MKQQKARLILLNLFFISTFLFQSKAIAENFNEDPYYIRDEGCTQSYSGQVLQPLPKGYNSLTLRVSSAVSRMAVKDFKVVLNSIENEEAIFPRFQLIKEFKNVSDAVSISNLPDGEWEIIVEDLAGQYISYEKVITISSTIYLEVLFNIKESYLKGKVIDVASKLPLANVKISAIGDKDGLTVITGADGSFSLGPLAGKRYEVNIYFKKEGYLEKRVSIKTNSTWEENMGDVQLYKNSKITGRLADASGLPLGEHFVYLIPEEIDYRDSKAVQENSNWIVYMGGRAVTESPDRQGNRAHRYLTDKNGFFKSQPLKNGRYILVFGDIEKNIKAAEVTYGETITVELQKK